MNKKYIIGLVLMGGFSVMLFLNFGQQVGGYMNFAEAEATGSSAHVVGMWSDAERHQYNPQTNIFTFYMTDEQGDQRRVEYHNPKPANFEDAEKLVIQGKIQGDVFQAEHILVKCPSKYNETQGPAMTS
jgi:cytochrome c-type biogenesis protein CcmE